MTTGGGVDLRSLRDITREACGFDPGPLAPATRLCDVGLAAFDLWLCVSFIEHRFGIEFPGDLLPAMETVDDLIYFTTTKMSHR
jgi:hypothetical protein